MRARSAWFAYILAGAAADLICDRKGDGSTLSQATRDTFHTDHPIGRFAFAVAFGAFVAWFPHHILDQPCAQCERAQGSGRHRCRPR